MRQDTNYAYAVGRIRVLEKSLLKNSDYDALIDAGDESFVTLLSGLGYAAPVKADDAAETDVLRQLADLFTARFTDTVREVMKFAPEPEVLSVFLLPADFSNAKICVKSIAGQNEVSGEMPGLSRGGTLPPEMIWDAVRKGEQGRLGSGFYKALTGALEELSVSGNARKSDLILDRACFVNMRELVAKGCYFTRKFMNRYLDIYADWTNILTAERIVSAGGGEQLFRSAYLHGSIAKERFVDNMTSGRRAYAGTSYEGFIETIGRAPAAQLSPDAADKIDSAALEKLADLFMARFLAFNSNEPYRIDALAAYLGALKLETRNLRMITVGRRSGTDKETIRELLRLTGRI
ncbi:MAG: V-type ATPase subunit [Clostridia bacterium]|nr:V-type ATPase subunit [Clostridia bacterium]